MADESRPKATIAPFTVEFGDRLNSCAFVIGCLSRLEVRGRWRRDQVPAQSLGEQMSQMPDVPGQQMTVYPRECKITITDPLENDSELTARINRLMAGTSFGRDLGSGMKPCPKMDLPLEDEDVLKTLVLTLTRWVECGNCWVVKGQIPAREQIDQMTGDELFDPANTNVHGKPRYVKDVAAWRKRIEMAGAV